MNDPFQLVTNCTFKGKDYLVQMCVLNSKKLEIIVTDKLMAEDWQCEYDASYIEALTHKTGNFKQFDVFIVMLKSGLLKTSECITLDLLTIEDLEEMRSKKLINSYSSRTSHSSSLNKRYLIITYSVEFDRIHYPLPLEYCGPPNPSVLQSNIRRLEAEVERLKKINSHSKSDVDDVKMLKEKIQNLTKDNTFLSSEVQRLTKMLSAKNNGVRNAKVLQNSLKKLEKQVLYEKNNNRQFLEKLRGENKRLVQQVEDLKKRENGLKMKLKELTKQIICKGKERTLQNYLSPRNSAERIKSTLGDLSEPIPLQSISRSNDSALTKFLSSSSSESETVKRNRGRSRDVKALPASRQPFNSKISGTVRKTSNDRSRHTSEDSTKKHRSDCPAKFLSQHNNSQGKASCSSGSQGEVDRIEIRSRESSLSSTNSSKHSKISRLSKRGSGDHQVKTKRRAPRINESNKEDLKFSMSDLETRIHALQKLLSEGLNF